MSGSAPWPIDLVTPMQLTLATESSFIRGELLTRQRRVSDVLNDAERPFILLQQVEMIDMRSPGRTVEAAHAQVNLNAVLFAVTSVPVSAPPELATPKAPASAFITIPPYTIIGHIHLATGGDLREGLGKLVGRFLPVTEATYWSEPLGVDRSEALMVAVNHARAHILAPFHEVVPVDHIRRRIGALGTDAGAE
jgi:hypothetical protein